MKLLVFSKETLPPVIASTAKQSTPTIIMDRHHRRFACCRDDVRTTPRYPLQQVIA